jgi:hypothetical protein
MDQKYCRAITAATTLAVAMAVAGHLDLGSERQARAVDLGARQGLSGNSFYNYYAPPGYAGTSAELYLCPRPTPPLVGHTWITYPPLLPHEYLYEHHRTYSVHNPDAGWTTVKVRWDHLDSAPWRHLPNEALCRRYSGPPNGDSHVK